MDDSPTFLDRAIAAVAPSYGARRIAARAKVGAATIALGAAAGMTAPGGQIEKRSGYRGAQSDRRQTRGWFAKPRSANSDVLGRHRELVGRSRDAAMNFPLATAAIERNVTFTIGTGLMAIPDLDADVLGLTPEQKAEWTRRMMRDFDAYMSSRDPDAERACTGYGLQDVAMRAMLEGGDVLALRCWPADQVGRVSMTAWKLLEADRVVSPANHIDGKQLAGNGPVVVGGIELDAWGAAQAYHALKQAPAPNHSGRMADDTIRYPAWGEKSGLPSAMLVFEKRRPEQARGVPFLAPVLETVAMIANATDAALLALVMQSMFAVIYKSPGATALPEPEYGTGELVQAEGMPETGGASRASDYRLEAGMALEIEDDATIENMAPVENPVFTEFLDAMATLIGGATGTPAGVLRAKFENSYTASKGELEVFYKHVAARVARFGPALCEPMFQCWLHEQVVRGIYDLPGFLDDPRIRQAWSSVRLSGDGKITLDAVKDRKAYEIDEAHGWRTAQQITAEISGGDFAANVEVRAQEHAQWTDAGLPVPNARGGGNDTSSAGGGQAPASEPDEDDADNPSTSSGLAGE